VEFFVALENKRLSVHSKVSTWWVPVVNHHFQLERLTSDSKINVTTDVGAMSEGISRHLTTAVDYRKQ